MIPSSPESLFRLPCEFFWGSRSSYPAEALPEFAFLGRSNVGKSSLLNAITYRKKLARTSKTPGQTQNLNFFNLGGAVILVDMPGYGYAKTSKKMKKDFVSAITSYLTRRKTLRCLFVLIDSRRGIQPIDLDVLDALQEIPIQVVYTKCDLARREGEFCVSTKRGFGVEELRSWMYHQIFSMESVHEKS